MIGAPHVHARVIGSTNEHARGLAAAGVPHGTVVTADEQTAGRGRQGRSWVAPPGRALLLSVVLRGLGEGGALLPLAAAVAVCEACESLAPLACAIKWPNDVWIDSRKVAGILVEGRPQEGWAVLGIGLNTATSAEELPQELAQTATSLAIAARREVPTSEALDALLPALRARLAHGPGEVLAAWRSRDALKGGPVRWSGGEGTAAGISDAGALLVDTASGRVTLDAGEVHLAPRP